MKKLMLFCLLVILIISVVGCVPKQKNSAIIIDKNTGEEFTHDEFYNSLQGITGSAVTEPVKEEIQTEEKKEDAVEVEEETGEEEVEEQEEPIQNVASTNERVAEHYERMRRYAGLIDLNILTKENCDEKRIEWQEKQETEKEKLLDLQEELGVLESSYENKKDLVETAIREYESALAGGDESQIESKDDKVRTARNELDIVENKLDDKEDEIEEKEDYIDDIDTTLDLIKDECVRLSGK